MRSFSSPVQVQLNPTTDQADKEEVGSVLRDTLFSVIRVHINIVHDYRPKANGSLHVGQKQGGKWNLKLDFLFFGN